MSEFYEVIRQRQLSAADARAMLALVAHACDPGIEALVMDRRRTLCGGLAELVAADGWISHVGVVAADIAGAEPPPLWADDGRRDTSGPTPVPDVAAKELYQFVQELTCAAHDSRQTLTCSRPAESSLAGEPNGGDGGRHHFLISLYPLHGHGVSGIGLVRLGGKPFEARDRTVVHAVWQRTDWLHCCDGELGVGTQAIQLTLRERQVVGLLLAGASKRSAAARLGLSEHTVGDYIKSIYRKLQVNSRLELMTKIRTVESVGPDRALDSAF